MGFGCGIFVYTGKYNPFSPSKLNDKEWKNWRSFFIQGSGFLKMKFSEHSLLKEIRVTFEDGKLLIN